MKRTKIRTTLVGIAAAAAVFVAGGCTPGGVDAGASGSKTSSASSAGVKGPRTGKELLFYLSAGHDYQPYKDVISRFEKKHNIKVTVQQYQWEELQNKLTADFLSGDVPDITEEPGGFWATRFGTDGNIMPLDDFIKKENNFLADFVKSGLALRQAEGKTYAIPLHVTMGGLVFANQKMLSKVGVKIPTTWDEFRAAAKAIQASGVKWGAALNNDYSYGTPWILQAGASYKVADTPLAPTSAAVKALTFQKDLIYKDKVAPVPVASNDYAGPRKLLTSGQAGLILSGPWDIAAIRKEAPGFPLALGAPLKGKENKTTIAGSGLMIPTKSQNAKLAWELIKALTDVKIQEAVTKQTGLSMSRKSWANSALVKNDPVLSVVAKAREIAIAPTRSYWNYSNIAKITAADKEMYEDVILNGADPAAEVQKFNKATHKLLTQK